MKRSFGTIKDRGTIISQQIEFIVNRYIENNDIVSKLDASSNMEESILAIFYIIFKNQEGKLLNLKHTPIDGYVIKYYSKSLKEEITVRMRYTYYGWYVYNVCIGEGEINPYFTLNEPIHNKCKLSN